VALRRQSPGALPPPELRDPMQFKSNVDPRTQGGFNAPYYSKGGVVHGELNDQDFREALYRKNQTLGNERDFDPILRSSTNSETSWGR